MDKIFAVMRREFIERVRTKAFIIGTVIVPLMTLGFGYLPQLLMQRETRPRNLVLLDAVGGATGDSVESALRAATVGTCRVSAGEWLRCDESDGWVVERGQIPTSRKLRSLRRSRRRRKKCPGTLMGSRNPSSNA